MRFGLTICRFTLTYKCTEQKQLQRGTSAYAKIPLVVSNKGQVLVIARDALKEQQKETTVKAAAALQPAAVKPSIPRTRPLSPTALRQPLRPRSPPRFMEGSSSRPYNPPDHSRQVTTFADYMEARKVKHARDDARLEQSSHIYPDFQPASRLLSYRGELGSQQHKKIVFAAPSTSSNTLQSRSVSANAFYASSKGNAPSNRPLPQRRVSHQPRTLVPESQSAPPPPESLSSPPCKARSSYKYVDRPEVEPIEWEYPDWEVDLKTIDHGEDFDEADADVFGPLS